jgi:predicted Fe-S protein YdhL (DUF1289 family)
MSLLDMLFGKPMAKRSKKAVLAKLKRRLAKKQEREKLNKEIASTRAKLSKF